MNKMSIIKKFKQKLIKLLKNLLFCPQWSVFKGLLGYQGEKSLNEEQLEMCEIKCVKKTEKNSWTMFVGNFK